MAATAQQRFGALPPGLPRVRAIDDWIHTHIRYQRGSSNALTSSREVDVQRSGVCRDFAHLGITLCRALGIPARLVVGYVRLATPPQDFHAIFEVWLGNQWVRFDPTRMAPPEHLVRVGTGADAKDVAFATLFGLVDFSEMRIAIEEEVGALAPQASGPGDGHVPRASA